MRSIPHLLWCLLVIGIAGHATEADLIDFEIEDQFKRKHRDNDWRGDVLVLIGSDRNGSQFDAVWTQAIHESIAGLGDTDKLRIAHIADVSGVPFLLRGMVKRKFPRDAANPIILDWKGAFATAYGFEEGKANILVFDTNAVLQHQVAVQGIDPQELASLVEVLVKML